MMVILVSNLISYLVIMNVFLIKELINLSIHDIVLMKFNYLLECYLVNYFTNHLKYILMTFFL